MSSDEDLPLTALAGANGNSHVAVNGNGHPNGDADDSPMSEDDMPLVCAPSLLRITRPPYNFLLVPGQWCSSARQITTTKTCCSQRF